LIFSRESNLAISKMFKNIRISNCFSMNSLSMGVCLHRLRLILSNGPIKYILLFTLSSWRRKQIQPPKHCSLDDALCRKFPSQLRLDMFYFPLINSMMIAEAWTPQTTVIWQLTAIQPFCRVSNLAWGLWPDITVFVMGPCLLVASSLHRKWVCPPSELSDPFSGAKLRIHVNGQ
jgi:hypothetical protein